jgi:hypothetical protein
MKHGILTISIILVSLISSLISNLPALVFPQLPSSFFGTSKVNGTKVPDGTIVQALIEGKVYAEVLTQTHQGDSVYALNVTGDDTDTTIQDGGREGDTVQFRIGGVFARQIGVWHSGTNVNLDLVASTSTPLATPMASLTLIPIQTTIPTFKPTTVPATLTLLASETATTGVQSALTPTVYSQASLTPSSLADHVKAATQKQKTVLVSNGSKQLKPASAKSENKPSTGSGNLTTMAVGIMVALVVVMIIGYIIMTNREKKK